MYIARRGDEIGRLIFGVLGVTLVLLVLFSFPSHAERMTSPSYVLNGNTGGTFGGYGNSPNYGMFSTGGEAIVGNGASGSYFLSSGEPADSVMRLTVQPSGLQGYYKFDENAGTTTVDSGAYKKDATITGAQWATDGGKLGSALSFENSGDRAEATNPVPTGDKLTVSMWVKRTSTQSNAAFASTFNYDGTGEGWAIQSANSDGTKLRVLVPLNSGDTGSNYIESTASNVLPADGAWRYISFVYDGAQANANRVKLYINGSPVAGTVTGTFPTTLVDNSTKLVIGNFMGLLERRAYGGVDHVKVFNRVLTDSQIAAEYTAQNTGIETGLTLGTVTPGASNTLLQDIIIRTNADQYGISLSQDHNLQKGAVAIPAVSGSIASPVAWNETSTKGLGFTLLTAPGLDSKWGSGANYAAIPNTTTGFYTRVGHGTSDAVDVLNSRLRLDTQVSQEIGNYNNTVTYTGTTIP